MDTPAHIREVRLQISIQKVPILRFFRRFTQSFQVNDGIETYIILRRDRFLPRRV
jgi:hypothetical protein